MKSPARTRRCCSRITSSQRRIPQAWRRKFGRSLRLWGGVDKRELARGPAAISAHLREFIPLIEEGGFIPTVDHTVPPDVPWDHFRRYLDSKTALLEGRFGDI